MSSCSEPTGPQFELGMLTLIPNKKNTSPSEQVTAPATRNKVLLSEKPADSTWEDKLVQHKALVKNFGRQTGARYYQKVEDMKVDNAGLKEEMIRKAAGDVVVVKPEAAVEQKGEESISRLLPPRNDMATHKEMVQTSICKD